LPANPRKRQAKWLLLLILFCLTTAVHEVARALSQFRPSNEVRQIKQELRVTKYAKILAAISASANTPLK
jgi:hypothetical protein